MKTILSIAGSDSSAGAGIQADLKTATAHGVYAMTAITAMTAQNTLGVSQIVESTLGFLEAQIEACLSDIPVDTIKIGMLPSAEQVQVVADAIRKYEVKHVVLDTVMVSTSGTNLSRKATVQLMEKLLFPLCEIITPNIPEAEALLEQSITDQNQMEEASKVLGDKYGCAALLKGGHSTASADDVFYHKGKITWFTGKRIDNNNTHGTGCTLSTAIACNLALGYELTDAVQNAKDYITAAIAEGLNLGHGNGPLAVPQTKGFPLRGRDNALALSATMANGSCQQS